jgi:activating signal cointegrator complex subunit 3
MAPRRHVVALSSQVAESLKAGNQVMVFVHSRKDTGKTARQLADLAAKANESHLLDSDGHAQRELFVRDVRKSRNREVCTRWPCPVAVAYSHTQHNWLYMTCA